MSVDKLVDSTLLDSDLTSVANAIRTKGETSAPLFFPDEFITAIMAIQTAIKRRYTGYFVNFDLESSILIEAQIEPTQSGSGDPSPSNVRPISGWTETKVTTTGKNLFDPNDTFQLAGYGTFICAPVIPGETYTFSATSGSIARRYIINGQVVSAGATITGAQARAGLSFTPPAGATKFAVNGWTGTQNYQLEHATSKSDYEAPTKHVYTFDLNGICYGGTLDVVTGVLTVTKANIASYAGETIPGEWISDRDVYAPGTTPTIGAQVVYDLENPQTVQLTPQQVIVIVGENNIWADTGDVNVEYAEIRT